MCLGKAQPARGLALPLDQRQHFQAGITGMKRRLPTPTHLPWGQQLCQLWQEGVQSPWQHRVILLEMELGGGCLTGVVWRWGTLGSAVGMVSWQTCAQVPAAGGR